MMKNLLSMVLLVICISNIFSQAEMKTRNWRKSQLDSLSVAGAMFEDQNFEMALPIYDKIQQDHQDELYLKYVTGVCGLFRSDMHEKALDFLMEVYAKNHGAEDIEYYLAKAYHYNYKFDEALELLDTYVKRKNITGPQKRNAMQLISYCTNAKELITTPVNATIENMGDLINTVNSEYVPLVSSDESTIIYTYRGDKSEGGLQNEFYQPDPFGIYYEDVFITHKENGTWSDPSGISATINTNEHDAAIALSNDGQKLFIFKDNGKDGGDIYMTKLENAAWSAPEKLKGSVNTQAWEGSASLSSDEKTLYFSSERPGGLGGKDIYKADLQNDGSWGNVKNLGSSVNTAFDDDAPFIHPDGSTLIYSSKGMNSMGGYDIFSTSFSKSDSAWSVPKNLGYPINTTDEDIYFVLSPDGNHGYYASGKPGGFGLQDIYKVEMPADYKRPVVEMVKGVTTLDDKPVKIILQVDMADEKRNFGTFTSNDEFGNYLVNLPSGHVYTLTYKLQNFPDQVQTLDLTALKEYDEKNIELKYSTSNTVAQTH